MQWTSALAIYILFWFGTLFLVLPFHARAAGREGHSGGDRLSPVAGTEPGAPEQFRIGRAALQTTLIAAALFGLYYLNYVNGWFQPKLDLQALGAPPLPR